MTDIHYKPTQQDLDATITLIEFMRAEEMNRIQGQMSARGSNEHLADEATQANDSLDHALRIIRRGWRRFNERVE